MISSTTVVGAEHRLACGLEEAIKWGAPCYLAEGRNIVGLTAFKTHVGL